MNLGEKLLELRKGINLSQEEVADKLNVSRQTVSKWETNQSSPDFDKIVPLCELYKITPDELFMGVKKEDNNKVNDDSYNVKKRARGIALGVFMFFAAIAFESTSIPVFNMDAVLSSSIFMLLCGVGVFLLIYTNILYKKNDIGEETKKEDIKNKEKNKKSIVEKQIDSILAIITVIIYLAVSFYTNAWHFTWIIWIIFALVEKIIELIFIMRSGENEK